MADSLQALATSIITTAVAQDCPLMNLPGEIRNRIWRFALPEQTVATKAHPRINLPAVSVVCKQILQETIGLFIAESDVMVRVHDCDGAFSAQSGRSFVRRGMLAFELGQKTGSSAPGFAVYGRPNWGNLVEWARAERAWYREVGVKRILVPDRTTHLGSPVVWTVSNTACALLQMEWEDLEPVFEGLHEMAKSSGPTMGLERFSTSGKEARLECERRPSQPCLDIATATRREGRARSGAEGTRALKP